MHVSWRFFVEYFLLKDHMTTTFVAKRLEMGERDDVVARIY
jgi:hypothetical protein